MTTLSEWQLVVAGLIIFGGFVVRGASGFGAGLVAAPLLALMMPLAQVVPITAMLAFVLFIMLTLRDRREVHWPEFKLMLWPTLIGVACGALVFSSMDDRGLIVALGCFIVLYSLYMLATDIMGLRQFKFSQRWAAPMSFVAAVIDTVFGSGGGTLVVIYLHGRSLPRAQFRATLAMLWFIEMIARIGSYTAAGFYTRHTLLLVAMALPSMALGTWVGERIGARISPKVFSLILAVVLMGTGVSLLVK